MPALGLGLGRGCREVLDLRHAPAVLGGLPAADPGADVAVEARIAVEEEGDVGEVEGHAALELVVEPSGAAVGPHRTSEHLGVGEHHVAHPVDVDTDAILRGVGVAGRDGVFPEEAGAHREEVTPECTGHVGEDACALLQVEHLRQVLGDVRLEAEDDRAAALDVRRHELHEVVGGDDGLGVSTDAWASEDEDDVAIGVGHGVFLLVSMHQVTSQ